MEAELKIESLKKWDVGFLEKPLVIAGPCSAESESQVMETAKALKTDKRVNVFRAGIWKPRTRPNAFEGVGSIGLEWMKNAKQETGFPISTEVANVKHVYECLKYGVDILWIGARTTANPFAVQEIADALKGVDVTVLIKNPVNPDLELWIGAIERIHKAGLTKLGVIHRGFSSYEKSNYRNAPQWQIPIELKRRMPDIPMICDPSHICGNRDTLFSVSQKAMDLDHDGLIIETHIDPEKALSDAMQQLTPMALKELLDKLVLRKTNVDNSVFHSTMNELRNQIDKLDDELLNVIQLRMNVAETIGMYKKENNVTILQSKRWDEIIQKCIEKGATKGLSADFVSKFFKAIHQESINHQTKIMNMKF